MPALALPAARVLPWWRLRPTSSTAWWVAAGFVGLLVLQIVLVRQGLGHLQAIGAAFEEVIAHAMPAERYALDMQRAAQNRIILLLRMLAQPDPFEREDDARQFEQQGLAFGQARDALLALPLPGEDRARLEGLLQQAVELSQRQRAAVQALVQGQDEQARALLQTGTVFERQRELVTALQDFAARQRQHAQGSQQQARQRQRTAENVLLGLGLSLFVLGVSIGVGVTRLTTRAERVLRLAKEQAERAAHTDALTGLFNRRGLEFARDCWVREASPRHHGLLLIDLDRFKPVNDQAGHDAGDALLKRIAQLLQDHVRPQDVVARLGGDEFAVLLRDAPLEAARDVAQRIVAALQDFGFEWRGQCFRIGASIGVTGFTAEQAAQDWGGVLKAADEACYRAKRAGRGQVAVAGA